jgi:hypothetical protein
MNGSGHYAVYKDDRFVTRFASTPSDHRWRENTMADLRRVGITPSNRPQKPAAEPKSLMSLDEITGRIKSYGIPRAQFARFITDDLATLQPRLRNFGSLASAEQTLYRLAKNPGSNVEAWVHEILDAAVRAYDSMKVRKGIAEGLAAEAGHAKIAAEVMEETKGPITPQSLDADKEKREREADEIIAEVFANEREMTEDEKAEQEKLRERYLASEVDVLTNLIKTVEKQQYALEVLAETIKTAENVNRETDTALRKRVERVESLCEQPPQATSRTDPRQAYAAALLQNVAMGYVNPEVLSRLDKLVGLDA